MTRGPTASIRCASAAALAAACALLAACGPRAAPSPSGADDEASSGQPPGAAGGEAQAARSRPELDWSRLPPSAAFVLSRAEDSERQRREREAEQGAPPQADAAGEAEPDEAEASATSEDVDSEPAERDDEETERQARDDGADPAETDGRFALRIARRFPEGAELTLRYTSVVDGELEMDLPGVGRRTQPRHEEVHLLAEARVEEATDAGRPVELELEVEELSKETSSGSEELLARGTRVEVRWDEEGEIHFDTDEPLEEAAEKALERALPDRTTEDVSWVPDEPVALGADWELSRGDVRRLLEGRGMRLISGGSASIEGRLDGRAELRGEGAVRLVFEGRMRNVTSEELPPDSRLEESTYDFRAETLVPADPQVPILQKGEVTMEGTMRLQMTMGGSDVAVTATFEQRQSTEYVPKD